ncbi:hypothetical protein MTR_2g049410 [Medicago truncatula]|uniref:Uncharacterized protein n=1 Tax=Medicago truncatula TaxID=3880 RepID=G7IIV1_MEDTR|nr:hypothetical protein MTR_2g049410 [Medicago truncatula]
MICLSSEQGMVIVSVVVFFKLEEALIRRIVQMDSPIDLDRGQPRKTISQTIKRDLERQHFMLLIGPFSRFDLVEKELCCRYKDKH